MTETTSPLWRLQCCMCVQNGKTELYKSDVLSPPPHTRRVDGLNEGDFAFSVLENCCKTVVGDHIFLFPMRWVKRRQRCDNAGLKVWLGLGRKSTWLESGKGQVFH